MIRLSLELVGNIGMNNITKNSEEIPGHNPHRSEPLPDELVSDGAQSAPAPKVEVLIRIDSQLLDQVRHLTGDPSRVIEVALRRWLRGGGGRDDDLNPHLVANSPVPHRGEWND
jgi:hypothetical protein